MTKQEQLQHDINTINETFNIDITSISRTFDVLWFRYYLIDKYRKCNVDNQKAPFKRTKKGIYSMRRSVREMANRSELKDIAEIIETLSVEKYNVFLKKYARGKYGIVISEPTKFERLPYEKVMKILRENRTSYLWKKEVQNYDYNDWNALKLLT